MEAIDKRCGPMENDPVLKAGNENLNVLMLLYWKMS